MCYDKPRQDILGSSQPNIDWKTSCIVMLLGPFFQGHSWTAIGIVELGKMALPLWGAVDAAGSD